MSEAPGGFDPRCPTCGQPLRHGGHLSRENAAYLTASEIFPMETRALCIAFFYAIGTAAGGIAGPLLFGKLIEDASASKDITGIAIGYFIGAALMIIGGVVEAFLGVKAEGQSLESIAQPLTVDDEPSSTTTRPQPA